ncbi:MAG TPA: DUF2474 family protein [Crenalkalicoccus sp.]|jgi:cell division septal protein FtsQ|nr:DUF2474 family protein [Crenalkalicoccus sp.]
MAITDRRGVRRALWFLGLWAGGVLVVGVVAWLIRLAIHAA